MLTPFDKFSGVLRDAQIQQSLDLTRHEFDDVMKWHKSVAWSIRAQALPGRFNAGLAETRGNRVSMEDSGALYENRNISMIGIFDGHGGRLVSDWASTNLLPLLALRLKGLKHPLEIRKKIKNVFYGDENSVDNILSRSINSRIPGSCVIIVISVDDYIYVVNMGDSRAVLFTETQAVRLTCDHKPMGKEIKKVEALGGTVEYFRGVPRVDGKLAVTRALGDFDCNIHRRPQISCITREIEPSYLIIATDGLWDVIHEDKIKVLIGEELKMNTSPEVLTFKLVEQALEMKSTDNISVVAIRL